MKKMIGKMKKRTKKTTGNDAIKPEVVDTLFDIFCDQKMFQLMITKEKELPADSLKWYSYHIQAMIEELGELMKADKRWKTHRTYYDPTNKEEEIADIFITLINICLFSNVGSNKLYIIVKNKIEQNIKRLVGE